MNIAFIELSSTKETNRNNPTIFFQYELLLSTIYMHSMSGPISGDTRLSVVGTFAFRYHFKLGYSVTTDIFFIKRKIHCYIRRSFLSSARKVHFSLSMNGRDFVDFDGLNFFISKSSEVLDFFPASGPALTATFNCIGCHLEVQVP